VNSKTFLFQILLSRNLLNVLFSRSQNSEAKKSVLVNLKLVRLSERKSFFYRKFFFLVEYWEPQMKKSVFYFFKVFLEMSRHFEEDFLTMFCSFCKDFLWRKGLLLRCGRDNLRERVKNLELKVWKNWKDDLLQDLNLLKAEIRFNSLHL